MAKDLKSILKEFDEEFDHDSPFGKALVLVEENTQRPIAREVKYFITQSIKDALEACRVEKVGQNVIINCVSRDDYKKASEYVGFNANTTQYDENVNKFLGEEGI